MSKLVRGFRDIFSPEADAFSALEAAARRVFKLYGATEVRVPSVELKELFIKSTGDTTDIVQKEMYAFEDGGGRSLALRPEGTPGVVRAYLEAGFANTAPVQKLFYIGNMFRAERPQAGRFREFEQIGLEYIGNSSPYADAECILILRDIVTEFGVKNFSVKLNSIGCPKCRPAYKAALVEYLSSRKDEMCEKCNDRLERNPLRVLDCKIDGPKFKETAPKMVLCDECKEHFDAVKAALAGRIDFEVDSNLVRGLDYYSRTVFEFQAGDMAQNAIAGGGRYDGLLESMGGPATPAVGFAMGADRTILARGAAEQTAKNQDGYFVVSLDKTCNQKAFEIMQELRARNKKTGGALFDKNLKAQMKAADKAGARYAVILGGNELERGVVTLKDLQTFTQAEITLKELYEKN